MEQYPLGSIGEERSGAGSAGELRSAPVETQDGYYGIPVIHKPHWKWLIIWYFYLGGISGASYALANIAQLARAPDADRIARAGRYISLAALLPSPALLILDLGRPEKFHHMLRVVNFRSPMSLGTWILSAFGVFCGLSAVRQAVRDGFLGTAGSLPRLLSSLPDRTIGAVGIVPALLTSGYTGVLLAATAVPLWTKNHLLMGPLFLASSLSNATAAITLALSLRRDTPRSTLHRLERLDILSLGAELGLLLLNQVRLGPVLRRPLRTGAVGRVYRFGVLGGGISLPLALQLSSLRRGHASRGTTALTSSLVLLGGFAFRYVIVMAGHTSADDPQATFALARKPKELQDRE